MMALFFDLATEKDFRVLTHPEKRERSLLALIRKSGKTIILFVDEAHDLPGKTLIELKRLPECRGPRDTRRDIPVNPRGLGLATGY